MGLSSGHVRRRKKRNSEKFEETALRSLWRKLFDGNVSRKRRRSRSSTSSSIGRSRRRRRRDNDDDRQRGRDKRGIALRTSSHRRRSGSKVSQFSGENESSVAGKESESQKVKHGATATLKKKSDDSDSDGGNNAENKRTTIFQSSKQILLPDYSTRGKDAATVENASKEATKQSLSESTNEGSVNAANMEVEKVTCEKILSGEATKELQSAALPASTVKTIEIAAGPTKTAEDAVSEPKNIPTKDENPKKNLNERETMAKTTRNETAAVNGTIKMSTKNVSKLGVSVEKIIEGREKTAPDAAIQDGRAESTENGKKTNDENAEKSSKKRGSDAGEESAQTEYKKLIESWKNIVAHGLSTSANAELIRKHPLSEDSRGFEAPILNPGLKSLLTGVQIVRDDAEIVKQNQLGASIRAIESGTSRIVNGNQRSSELARVVVTMNEAASIIAEVHYSSSIARRKRVVRALGVEKFETSRFVGETLFSPKEETEIKEKMSEARLLRKMNEDVEKRLAAAKNEESERARKNEAEAQTGNEEREASDGPCSQRFGASRHSGRTIVRAKPEVGKSVKSEEKFKPEKLSTRQ